MPFMLSDFLAGQQGMQEAIDTQQARQGLKDVYSNMPSADENGSQNPFQTQVGYLQKQIAKAGATGNVKLWQTLSKELDSTLDKQSKYDIRSANMAAKKQQAVGSAINGILAGMDEKTGYVPPETMKEIVSNLSESDPEKARNLWANYVQQGGVYTPEMQKGLKATLAQSMTAKDAATIAETQANHKRQEKESAAKIENYEANTALHRQELANLRAGKTKAGGVPTGADQEGSGIGQSSIGTNKVGVFTDISGETYTAENKLQKDAFTNLNQGYVAPKQILMGRNNLQTEAATMAAQFGKNLGEFNKGQGYGTLGVFSGLKGDGVSGALVGDLTRAGTARTHQMYEALMKPLPRLVQILENAGVGGNKAQMEALQEAIVSKSSTDEIVRLQKVGELSTLLNSAFLSMSTNKTLNPGQRKILADAIKNISEALPFNQGDVIAYANEAKKRKVAPTIEGFEEYFSRGATPDHAYPLSSEKELSKVPDRVKYVKMGGHIYPVERD